VNRSEPEGQIDMATEAFSVRTDPKKIRKLDKLAEQQDRSRNYLVNQAIDQYLELLAWQDERIKEGIKAADAGRFASDAEMDAIFNKYKDA
jgi:predicted transcriptional regulator